MSDHISIEEFGRLGGRELPASGWVEIDQERIDLFARATNDYQFIHTDPEKAAETPFGGTIAHGFLTLSLLSDLMADCWPVPEGLQMGLNYGSDKVRFLAPVKVGQRVRAKGTISDIGEKRPGQWLIKTKVSVEIEGETTPALIAEILTMFIVASK